MPELEDKIKDVEIGLESANQDNSTAAENTNVTEEVAAPSDTDVEVRNEDGITKGSDTVESTLQNKKTGPSELEKAQYSFHKQFARQKSKYEKQYAELKAEFDAFKDRFEHPDKYKAKTRADFEYDDDYIDYRSEQKFNALMEAKLKEEQKKQQESEALQNMTNYYREKAQKNIENLFKTDEEKQHYKSVLDSSPEELKLLEQDEGVAGYFFRSKYGPAMLLEILENKETYLPLLFEDPYMTSADRRDIMRDIERDVKDKFTIKQKEAEEAAKAAVTQEKPVIGKPGLTSPGVKDIFDDEKSLTNFLRSRQ